MIDLTHIIGAGAALFLVLALLLGISLLLKFNPKLRPYSIPGLKIQGKVRIDNHHQLLLLEFRGEEKLILLSPQGGQVIAGSAHS